MTAYNSAVFDDLVQKISRGEKLTAKEQSLYQRLDVQARQEWENKPRAFQYGGDMEDVF
jgi:hypothetical protein